MTFTIQLGTGKALADFIANRLDGTVKLTKIEISEDGTQATLTFQ